MRAVIVIEVTQDPNTGMIHFHDRGDAFGGAEPEDWNFCRIRHGISIESNDLERVGR